jgi:hypothetical protein
VAGAIEEMSTNLEDQIDRLRYTASDAVEEAEKAKSAAEKS